MRENRLARREAPSTGVVVMCDLQLHADAVAHALEQVETCVVLGAASDVVTAVEKATDGDPRCERTIIAFDAVSRSVLGLVRVFARRVPGAELIALGVTERDFQALADAGAHAYVRPDGSLDDLLESVGVARGDGAPGHARSAPRFHSSGASRVPEAHDSILTLRELEVVALIAEGLTNDEIGRRLNIALPTVKNHVHSVFAKLAIKRRAQAAAWFRERSHRWSNVPAGLDLAGRSEGA